MKRECKLTIGTLGVLFLGVVLSAGAVCAQTVQDLAGTWTSSPASPSRAGTRPTHSVHNPKGILIVDANGRYVIAIARAGLPKVASNNRTTGTPEENKAIVRGSLPTSAPFRQRGGQDPDLQDRDLHVPQLGRDRTEAPFHRHR